MGTGTIFGGRGASMDIGKAKDNFDKEEKPRCFNYNISGHMAKKCQKPKKDNETRKCYNCNKVGYLAKDCRSRQKMKTRSMQEESNEKTTTTKRVLLKVWSRHDTMNLCT